MDQGWYVSSTGEIRQADGYPAPAFWVRVPDPERVHDTGDGRVAPEEDDRMIVAVPGPFGIVGVPVRLAEDGASWRRDGEVEPIGAFHRRARDAGEEVVGQWHKDGRLTRQEVYRP